MLEETVASAVHSSIWASFTSWCTPTVLFLFLNIMIGTIAITSSLASQKPATNHDDHHHGHHRQHQQQQQQEDKHHHQPHHQQQLWRSPSMLQRLKSINFYNHRSQEPQAQPPATVTLAAAAAPAAEGIFDTTHYFGSYAQQQPQENTQQQQPPVLSRSPSMLQRLKSFNPYNYLPSPSPAQIPAAVAGQEAEIDDVISNRERQIEEEEAVETLDEIYSKLRSGNKLVGRSNSDTKPVAGEVPKKLAKKMRKSASTRSAFAHFEEEQVVEARRPATVKEGKSKKMVPDHQDGEDSGVDAKADDFINKFKQQLKLQRMDSIIRNKEMVGTRGK